MTESTVVACPNCGKKYKIATDKLGRTFKCTGCETRFKAGVEVLPPLVPSEPSTTRPIAPRPPVPLVTPPDQQESDQPSDQSEDYASQESSQESSQETSQETGSNESDTSADANYAVARPKASGMAIASLICGLLLCLAPITSPLALIFGYLGLKKSRQGRGGRGLSITGIVLGILGLALIAATVLVGLPMLPKIREAANRAFCAAHMKQVAMAMTNYRAQNQNQFPPDLTTLWKAQPTLTGSAFICPDTIDTPATNATQLETGGHLSFKYLYPGPGNLPADPTQVILYEGLMNHAADGTNIGFADGHVQWYTTADSTPLISKWTKH